MSASAEQSELRSERRGAALVVTIDRPGAANSIDLGVIEGLEAAVATVRADATLGALVITAAGSRFFAAGGDIKRYAQLKSQAELDAVFERPRVLLDAFEAMDEPVIAAVNGLAVGGGVELLLACDLRIGAERARLGFPYTKLGVMPGWNGTERLVRDCGYATAMGLLLRGATLDAHEAKAAGLLHEVVADDALDTHMAELIDQLASSAPLSLAATKRGLRACMELPGPEQRRLNADAFARLWVSDDHREAEQAFIDKRSPAFKGR